MDEIYDYKYALDESCIVAITDTKGIIKQVNDNFCKISQYQREELIGQDHRIVNSGYHTKEFISELWRTIANGKTWSGDIKNKAKDGTYYWVSTTIVPFLDEHKKPYQYVAICADITKRKEAEKQLKESEEKLEIQNSLSISTITSYKDILIFSINKEYQYLIFNEAFKSATHQAYGTEVITGKSMLDNITNEDEKGKAKNNCDKALAGEGHMTLEIFGDLTRYYYETRYNPITDGKGQVIGVTVMSSNVTERIHSEQQLIELNKELDAFTYSVSHDLRAPLRAVNGYAEMLNEDYGTKLDEEGKRIIENISYNTIKMGTLIDDLLAFSKLGRKEVQHAKINMNELVEGVFIDMAKSFSHKAEIKIGKLHHVKADYGLLYQVMFNLISNAIKYSSKKKNPVVEIFSEEKNGEIVFSVKDNGAGFDMKYYDKLFGVFQRLHKESEFEGVGVGLAIVQRIIAKHEGKVWGEGKVNEGAQFNFSLTRE